MTTTIFKLSEECLRIISGGNPAVASKVDIEEVKLSVCEVGNQLLKTEYFQVNGKIGETIPNGTCLGLYENIVVTKWKNVSQCMLPVMPLHLPRNMGIYSIFDAENPSQEFIPLQRGQWGLLQSQRLINDLLGQCGYESFGMQIVFTKDISNNDANNPTKVNMRLAIMDISLYGDYDPLPVLPEHVFLIKQQVPQLYGVEVVSDKLADPGRKEQKGIPVNQQAQQ